MKFWLVSQKFQIALFTLPERVFTEKFSFLCSQKFRLVLAVAYDVVTSLFRGLGVIQFLFLIIYLSGLWRPLLRYMYIKRKALMKFKFILGNARKRLGSSVLYYQAWGKGFWATRKALEETTSASSSPNLILEAKRGVFPTKFFSWLDRSDGTLLLCYCIPTVRSFLWNFGFRRWQSWKLSWFRCYS